MTGADLTFRASIRARTSSGPEARTDRPRAGSEDDDGGVDDVGGGLAAENACGLGGFEAHGYDVAPGEELVEPDLAVGVPPRLADDHGGHVDVPVVLEGEAVAGPHAPVVADGDQRTGVVEVRDVHAADAPCR
ncbi:hypothetical protein KYY02_02520 [Streptomyces pimonensis]|uniref:Uncharacterized protein n=1 Tax=Streptomyces pimonensis TaxID=2860288 RepID=A0ABV4IUC5_9ACTN